MKKTTIRLLRTIVVVLVVSLAFMTPASLADEIMVEGEASRRVEEQHQEQQQQQASAEQETVPEDPVVPEQEPEPWQVVQEEVPKPEQQQQVTEEETAAAPVEEDAQPVVPVEEETVPVQEEEEVPPVDAEVVVEAAKEEGKRVPPPPTPATTTTTTTRKKNDDSLFEITIFECVAPRADPAPPRDGPVPSGSIMTLCFRPKHVLEPKHVGEDKDDDDVSLQAIVTMDYKSSTSFSPNVPVVRNNQASDPMTRVVCPFRESTQLCIVATKLNDSLFSKTGAGIVEAVGTMVVQRDATGEQRTVPFSYSFETSKAKPPPPPVEHEYFDMPANQPPFPCTKEIRIWMIAALLLSLLEFAFSPSTSTSSGESSSGSTNSSSGSSDKKKKPKEKPKKE